MESLQETVNCIRAFNRFYVVRLGYLNQNYLGTGYTITDMFILYEIQQTKGINAKALCDKLCMDKSYISRVLRTLEAKGLLVRQVSSTDHRSYQLFLTPLGEQETERTIDAICANSQTLLADISPQAQKDLCGAMELIMKTLS